MVVKGDVIRRGRNEARVLARPGSADGQTVLPKLRDGIPKMRRCPVAFEPVRQC